MVGPGRLGRCAADGGGAAGGETVATRAPSASAARTQHRPPCDGRTGPRLVRLATSVALSADGRVVYVAGGGELHAVDVDGRRRWRVGLGARGRGPVVTAEGVYCAVSDGYGNELPSGGGEPRPAAGGGRRTSRSASSTASPWPAAAWSCVGTANSGAGGVRAYAPSGELRWERQMQRAPDVSPVVSGSVAYVGSFGNSLHALDVTDGSATLAARTGP